MSNTALMLLKSVKRALLRAMTMLHSVFWGIISLPFVLLIRILKPFVIVRLVQLDIGRIGGTFNAYWYLCEKECGSHTGKNYFDVFYFIRSTEIISNRQWLKMWKRALATFPLDQLAFAVDNLNRKLPGSEKHLIPLFERQTWQLDNEAVKCVLKSNRLFLSFTEDEIKRGQEMLRNLGIPEGQEFVCFHNRDSAYLDKVYPKRDWSYHDCRDSNVEHYIEAAKEMVSRGYVAIRLGAEIKNIIKNTIPGIIDYAGDNAAHNDLLDVYLGANCRFLICSETGLAITALVFKRPILFVNYVVIDLIYTYHYNSTSIAITKKFFSNKEKRLLTFKEIIERGLGRVGNGEIFKRNDITLVENSPEEIKEAAIEMDERIKGIWKEDPEDEKLQQKYWALYDKAIVKNPNFRIGAEFLRKYKDLLI